MKNLLFGLAGLLSLAVTATGYAGIEADPNKEYKITPEVGSWVICAASYTGPKAQEMAHELILEIRSRFSLPAFVFNHGEEERRKQQETLQRIHEQYKDYNVPLHITRIQEQCAVLIGGYKDFDAATRALKDIKKLQPPANEKLMNVVFEVVPVDKTGKDDRGEIRGAPVNPFATSFVTRNPTVPHENKPEQKTDPFLKKLNANEEYSLLNCKKPWTLVIATYQGMSVIQGKTTSSSFLDKLWGNNSGTMLDASAQNAHNLAAALRKGRNLEAYVLHTRQGSLVTINGYDRADDPRMQHDQEAIAEKMLLGPQLQLLPQPFAMPVPRP